MEGSSRLTFRKASEKNGPVAALGTVLLQPSSDSSFDTVPVIFTFFFYLWEGMEGL